MRESRVRFTTLTTFGATAIAVLALVGSAKADEPLKSDGGSARAETPATPDSRKSAGNGEQQFQAIVREYESALAAARVASEKEKSDFLQWKAFVKLMPDVAAFSKRLVDLAAKDPKKIASRDALLWVLNQPGMGPGGLYADEFTRAVLLLLRYHADDAEVARLGLGLDNIFTPGRDLLLDGIYVRATSRETKGLARLALGNYLAAKSTYAAGVRKGMETGTLKDVMRAETYNDSGKLVEQEFPFPPEELAYRQQIQLCDPEVVRAEARRLLREVIDNYGDIPFVTRRHQKLRAILKEGLSPETGKPLTADERAQVERMLARKQTIADVAKARLDELENLIVGKPAPPIDGTGMDGKPLKLSDYQGKVVVLVFWGTWCGPCMAAVPHERELVERNKGKPFALLGINCDGDKDAALKVMQQEKMTWPNWNDGEPGDGPIVQQYHVHGYPTTFVLDDRGIIRQIGLLGSALEKAVDNLLDTMTKGKASN
jgi:thiol-disulfide isomerase/thioredoxin